MRADKLKTALSRDPLAYLAPPDMFFFSCEEDYEFFGDPIHTHILILEILHTHIYTGAMNM